jgi:Thioredoxin like C-terminal domain
VGMATGFDGGHPLCSSTRNRISRGAPADEPAHTRCLGGQAFPGEKDWAQGRPCPLGGHPSDPAERANRRSRLAKKVYIVAAGTGTLTVNRHGTTSTVTISGPPNLHEIAASDESAPGQLELRAGQGLQAFSFTYG